MVSSGRWDGPSSCRSTNVRRWPPDAYIRHRFADYEDQLVERDPFEGTLDDLEYRDIKRRANDAVDDFLTAQRRH